MAVVTVQLPKSFPRRRGLSAAFNAHRQGSGTNLPGLRGLGASNPGGRGRPVQPYAAMRSATASGTTNYWGGSIPPGAPVQPSPAPVTNIGNPRYTSYGAGNWGSSRQQGGWGGSGNGSGGGGGYLSQAQTSSPPTQADIQAFQAALENATALGVITTQQAAQLQAQATQSSDQELQSLTAQINSLVASTPSAQAAAAASNSGVAGTAATTSWWDGSTSIFGTSVSNPTLVIGAGLAAVALWAAFKKK